MNNRLLDIFENVANSNPENVAFDYSNKKITYQEFQTMIAAYEQELIRIGVKKETKVLLQVEEPETFAGLIFAIWKLQALFIPVEKKVAGKELARAKEESNCEFYLTTLASQDGMENMDGDLAYISYEKIIHEKTIPCAQDTALMFYTSGTTGLPKCVSFLHDAMRNNIMRVAEKMELSAGDVFYTPLALTLPATITTVLLPALCSGTTLFVSNTQLPRAVLKAIRTNNVTVFFAVPYMYELMLQIMNQSDSNPFEDVRVCVSSSAFMKPYIFEQFYEKTDLLIHSIYCSSEAGAITYNDAEDLKRIKESVGRPLPGVKVSIYAGQEEAKGDEEGEIVVSGANISNGYFNRPELTEKVFLQRGISSGDLANMDQDNFLYLRGRISDVINVAGYLVNPKEVEDMIVTMDGVAEVVVYAEKRDMLGECIAAKVILENKDKEITEQDIIRYCTEHMSNYKVPRKIEFVDSIQTGRYGKKVRKF